MLEVWDSWGHSAPTKNPLFSSNKVTFRKCEKLWTKSTEWNNADYEEKEKSHYFTHPAQDTTNSHSHFNQKERMGTWEKKRDSHLEKEKVNKEKKTGEKLKESR